MQRCPNCDTENPEHARFCLACGTALVAAPAGEERKVVSVLFVDLVGFTAGADRADPEDVRATLRPYHARVTREIERFGGTVEKFVGDAVMAVFGAPVAHEDDPERAVRAALRILDAIEELNEQEGLALAVRGAVNTGEAVVSLGAMPGTGEGIATGDVVNTAARLQAEAPSGGLVVGEQTYRATRHAVDYETLTAVAVKGKAEPVSLWRALGARSRFGVDVESAGAEFVGRDRELHLLKGTYERMLGESQVQLVTITGEPGVGKTRLLAELRRWIDERPELVHWRQGRCLPYGDGITFWALGEIVKAHTGILVSDPPAVASSKLAAAVESLDEPRWLLARLGPLVGLVGGDTAERDESFTAWQRFLEGVAAASPLVLVLEDLHWADLALLEFVERLVEWSTGVPILVLCTARPELYERHPGWSGGTRNAVTISLSPLSADETAQLIAGLLDTSLLPADTQAALLERAGGNPLYAEEYVRLFLELGTVDDLRLPETVHGIIAARLDTLPPDRKALLHDAAVIGKVFWAGALEVMGGRNASDVRDALHQLARKELLRPARLSSVEGQQEYAFWHALVRDVAYGQIPRAQRASKHESAARWIEGVAGDRVADYADLLAHHTTEALELARTAGEQPDPELVQRAARYLVLAGDRSFDLDLATARQLYRRALALLPEGTEEHGLALLRAGEVGQNESRFEDARVDYERATAELEAVGAVRLAARAYGLLANVYFQLGGTERMQEALHRALELLEGLPPGPELVNIYGRMAALENMKGLDPRHGLAWAQRAIELGESLGTRRELIRPLQWRGFSRCELGDLAGLEDLERALRETIELGVRAMPAYVNLADAVWRQRGPAAALEIQQAGLAYNQRHGGGAQTWLKAEMCWMLYDLGEWNELLRLAEEIQLVEAEHGAAQPGGMAQAYATLVLAWRGLAEHGATRELLAHARAVEDPQVLAPALVAAALVNTLDGDKESALSLVEEYYEATRNRAYFRSQNLTDTVRIACARGDVALAERLLDNVITAAERDRLSQLTSAATIAQARGNGEAAAPVFADAAAGWAAFGCRLEQALALRGAGDEARASAILAELGARPLEDQLAAARTAK